MSLDPYPVFIDNFKNALRTNQQANPAIIALAYGLLNFTGIKCPG
jgi:hypothetical protein